MRKRARSEHRARPEHPAAGNPRHARVMEEMRKVLSDLLLYEVKDPRLDGVTISTIDLSPDRTSCRVFFSLIGDGEHLIGDAERERQAADGFSAAGSFVRRELGRRMRLRTTPELTFSRDTSFEYGDRMERLFDRLHEQGLLPKEDTDTEEPEES